MRTISLAAGLLVVVSASGCISVDHHHGRRDVQRRSYDGRDSRSDTYRRHEKEYRDRHHEHRW